MFYWNTNTFTHVEVLRKCTYLSNVITGNHQTADQLVDDKEDGRCKMEDGMFQENCTEFLYPWTINWFHVGSVD